MEIIINFKKLKNYNLSPNQYVLLFLLYNKDFNQIKELYGVSNAIQIRNSLINTNFILSDNTVTFRDTILSNNHVMKLLNIKSDVINFWEFYTHYPIKVGSRVLRAAGPTSQVALKHEKKYLKRIKTIEQHQLAINSLKSFVSKQKQAGKLEYLPNMETVMNNSMWEQWEIFINEQTVSDWNNDTI